MSYPLNPPSFPIEIVNLDAYNEIPIGEILKNLFLEGIVTNIDNPEQFSATMDAYSTLATLTVPVLKGGAGNPGNQAISPYFENVVITDLDQLPTDLGDTDADLGRFYIYSDGISTTIYVWTGATPDSGGTLGNIPGLGQGFIQLPVGQQGSPGPYPDLQPRLFTMPTGNGLGPYDTDSWITVNDNAIQVVTIAGTATAGSLALTFETTGATPQTTKGIAYGAISASTIQSALEALSNVGAGNVQVFDTYGSSPYTVVFSGSLDVQGISVMGVASAPAGTTVTVTTGSAADPAMAFYLAPPQGVQGPSSPLGAFIDVDFQTVPPQQGDVIAVSTRVTPLPPTGVAASAGSAGSLAARTYYYVVTACVPNGETAASQEVSATTTGSNGSVELTWAIPSGDGATGYRIYRGTSPGAEDVLVGVVVGGQIASFVDVGSETVAGSAPAQGIPANQPIWVNQPQTNDYLKIYTVPPPSFSSGWHITFLGGRTTVGSFNVPPQPFAWVPIVFGEVTVDGISLSLSPLQAQCLVTLGSTWGQSVASGVGSSTGLIQVVPDLGYLPATPQNGVGVVPANHVGSQGTLFISLVNEGLLDVFDFNSENTANLSVLVVPVYDVVSTGTYATLNVKAIMGNPTVTVS